jgi:hypothetical protein
MAGSFGAVQATPAAVRTRARRRAVIMRRVAFAGLLDQGFKRT